ncbi:hypothetical protein [Flaviaesturariibacter aridisoli]|uniref:Uncharacterized protein n=1 Tax=Flaviaesturariibacter aridisoli TaxID=2545761 RepID=A0A4V2WN30_9BACT|nr:hypothetical protein [Flaviaesturariibacter aridisoli]TCZ73892.1 hypothetical protein E0486_04210 [Flaviaesturariibacter aridisoli]
MNRKLVLAFFLMIAMAVTLQVQGRALSRHAAAGILALEFAWTEDRFQDLMYRWLREDVLTNLWLDFLFIPAYGWFFRLAAQAQGPRLSAAWAKRFAWLAVVACLCDVCENGLLLARVYHEVRHGLLVPAALFAAIKFALLLCVLLFVLYGLIAGRKAAVPSVS